MATIKDGFSDLSKATSDALNGIRKASGVTTDRDVIRYESLQPMDFEKMAQDFGQDSVFNYIKEMEIRRLMPQNQEETCHL